jgi:hypothetical protein
VLPLAFAGRTLGWLPQIAALQQIKVRRPVTIVGVSVDMDSMCAYIFNQ